MANEPDAGNPAHLDDDRGVYAISVVAELVGTGVQNLRLYERRGLLTPSRSRGGTRLYSRADVVRLQRIIVLLEEGLNLVGIALVLELEADLREARGQLDHRRRSGQARGGTRA